MKSVTLLVLNEQKFLQMVKTKLAHFPKKL